MIEQHLMPDADVTAQAVPVLAAQASRFCILKAKSDGRVTHFCLATANGGRATGALQRSPNIGRSDFVFLSKTFACFNGDLHLRREGVWLKNSRMRFMRILEKTFWQIALSTTRFMPIAMAGLGKTLP